MIRKDIGKRNMEWTRNILESVVLHRVICPQGRYKNGLKKKTGVSRVFHAMAHLPPPIFVWHHHLRCPRRCHHLGYIVPERKFALGIAITCDRANRLLSLSHTAKVDRLVEQYKQSVAHSVDTPMVAGPQLQRLDNNLSTSTTHQNRNQNRETALLIAHLLAAQYTSPSLLDLILPTS